MAYNKAYYKVISKNSETAKEIMKILIDYFQPSYIVDVGCGTGEFLIAA